MLEYHRNTAKGKRKEKKGKRKVFCQKGKVPISSQLRRAELKFILLHRRF